MISPTPTQTKAINEIVNHYYDNKRLVDFIAPTGSGKTFMIANVISKILKRKNSNEKIIFIIFTLSNAELPIQFENKLIEYQNSLDTKYSVKYCSSPSSFKNKTKDNDYFIPSNYDVLIFGTQSFGKGTIYSQLGRFHDLIQEKKDQGYKIIYIRDEAHIGDKKSKNDAKNEQEKIKNEADFIIKMTATPDTNENNAEIVYISEKDLVTDDNHYLIKDKPIFNDGFSKDVINDEDILDNAIDKFKEVKIKYYNKNKEYHNQNIINPCMLIQISSTNQEGDDIDENDTKIDEITKKLNSNGLSWVIYLANRKESSHREGLSDKKNKIDLKNISANNSNIDVVIFKIGPATGWDIPRACMLVQLRRVCSDKLSQQVIGRIKRNPNKNLSYDDLYMKYWVYSDHQEKTREIHKYVLENKFKEFKFPSIHALDKEEKKSDARYKELFNKHLNNFFIKNKEDIIQIYKNDFIDKNNVLINQVKYISSESISPIYEERLKNILEIKKYIFKAFEKNNWLHKIPLQEVYQEHFKEVMHIDQYYFIFCRDYLDKIIQIKNKFFANNGKYGIRYDNKLPEEFIVYEGKDVSVDFDNIKEIYGYRHVLLTNKDEQTIQYLDSNPEQIYLRHLIDKIEKRKLQNKLDILVKNPLASKVYMEYWNNKEAKYSNAYIDFIIKVKHEETFLFIEVKSINDYDEMKTKSIKDGFTLYKEHIDNSNANIFLSVVVIDKNQKTITKQIVKDKSIGLSINKKNENFDFNNLDNVFDYIERCF